MQAGFDDGAWELGGLEVGGWEVGSWRFGSLEVGVYLESGFRVFLNAAMLFIKSKACL